MTVSRMIFKGLLSIGVCMLLAGNAAQTFAQGTTDKKPLKVFVDPILGTTTNVDNVPIYQKKKYYEGNLLNLSKLYWAVGMHKISDNNAIDGFLRINECDLYKKYFSDDFKWEEIREATRRMLVKERHTYPTTFEILLPLALGRYDVRKELFNIKEETSFVNMRKIDIALGYENYNICDSPTAVRGYPYSVIMLLDQPFNFTQVPVKPEIADLFIHESTVVDERLLNFERDAYLRVLVSFSSYVETVNGPSGTKLAVMHAKIDAIEVYADAQRTKPLYMKDFAEIRRRYRSRVADESLKDEVDKAFTSLMEPSADDNQMYQLR